MKNLIIFGIFVVAMVLVQFAQAQSVEDIVDKYLGSLGGKDKLMTLKTIKMEGIMGAQGIDLAITSTRSKGIGIRLDIEVMGTSNYQVANATKGSVFWPIRGMTEPADMDQEQFKSAINQMDLEGALCNYKTKGTTVELIGKEKVDGVEAYQLKVIFKNGIISNYFIDSKTGRLVKSMGKQQANGEEIEVISTFDDYRQNDDGYWFPYSVTNMQGTIIYDKILTNIPIDESIYKN